jgi:hypothetical protein
MGRIAASLSIALVVGFVVHVWRATHSLVFASIALVEAGAVAAILWATVPIVFRRPTRRH